jgi:hypothetical protein
MSFDRCLEYARSIAEMAVESCSKGILALLSGHGKSPWFLGSRVLTSTDVDEVTSISYVPNGAIYHG